MQIKVQTCWSGHTFKFRALVCGGLLVSSADGKWTRAAASEMLDLVTMHINVERSNVRFIHV